MHYAVTWTFKPEQVNTTIERFMETGAPPPEGVNMISRWHDVAGGRGFAIVESDDLAAVAKWCREWGDLLSLEVIPVLNDEQMAQVLTG